MEECKKRQIIYICLLHMVSFKKRSGEKIRFKEWHICVHKLGVGEKAAGYMGDREI